MARRGVAHRAWTVSRVVARRLVGGRGQPLPHRVRRALVELGPTFVKAGQIVASSPGLFPSAWIAELDVLRDRVPPFPGAEARRTVEAELGRPLRSAFRHFGDEPLAAASIAQVHPATLLDGSDVVVKVQRPGLQDQVRDDVRALLLVCEVLERIPQTAVASPRALAEDFARTLHQEMDFRLEADSMARMRAILAEAGTDAVRVPAACPDLVSRRVLTMERIDAIRFTDVETMRAAGVDTAKLLRLGAQTLVEGVLVHGFFHGDLHAGNIGVLPDGGFVLYDFGIVGRLSRLARRRLAAYVVAATLNDYPAMVRALRSFGAVGDEVDEAAMAADLERRYAPFVQGGVASAQLGALMETMVRTMVRWRVRIPRELVLLTKQMLYLEGAARTLAPDLDLLQEQQVISAALALKHPDLFAAVVPTGAAGPVASPG